MKNEEINFKPSVIKDYFYLKNQKIVILDNNAFKGINQDMLILAKLVEKDGDLFIESLSDEEYDAAAKKYDLLINMFEEEGENE